MPSLVAIRRRIKSAKNISQITKAMEMVSASKMKRAQAAALSSRPFASKLENIISNIASSGSALAHLLMQPKKTVNKAMLIMVSTNKGLCGSLNVNLFRKVNDWSKQKNSLSNFAFVGVHKKAKNTITLEKNSEVVAVYHDLGEKVTFEESRVISRQAIDAFTSGQVDEVYIAYPKFISTLQNQPVVKQLLPILPPEEEQVFTANEYTFEPSIKDLLSNLVPYQVEMSVYQILVEASASEHSARMVAMKSASDNAKELIGSLTLDYNQARQSAVTSELLDATTARMAIS